MYTSQIKKIGMRLCHILSMEMSEGVHVLYRVATGQGNSRSGKSQGMLQFVREI